MNSGQMKCSFNTGERQEVASREALGSECLERLISLDSSELWLSFHYGEQRLSKLATRWLCLRIPQAPAGMCVSASEAPLAAQ